MVRRELQRVFLYAHVPLLPVAREEAL